MTEQRTENDDMEALVRKVERNEWRARDAEARLRILEAEINIIEKRKILESMRG
jgi:hypothetical protein